ncbi:MAG TPA: outer membrane beta-barrel protein [Saprospiraceae bacterium]|nr:outer membrane beta-barrel protein [Saprospiraceae bacterium]
MVKYIFVFFCMLSSLFTQAQSESFGYGFRAGMSFAKIDGPSELGPNGENLEKNKMASGFHIGMTFSIKMTDIMGVRAELLYSQRGTDYTYDGPSYFFLGENPQAITLFGNRRQTINLSNSFVDIPLSVYYKIGYFEILGGLNTGILVSSAAGGSVEFEGVTPIGNALPPFGANLNYNYKTDDAGFAAEDVQIINVDGKTYELPQFLGAYYGFDHKEKSLYKTLDFGLIGGIAYYLNDGLYLGARYIYGLGDVDRNFYDLSLKELDANGNPVQRGDNNRSKSLQFSIGFTF